LILCCPPSAASCPMCAKQGDRALLRYAAEFDNLTDARGPLRVTPEEDGRAWEVISPALRAALITAEGPDFATSHSGNFHPPLGRE